MINIYKIFVFLIFGMDLVHTMNPIDKDGYCTKENITVKTTNGTDALEKKYCCRNYEKKNNKCIECKLGYVSIGGQPCQQCEAGMYGKKCAFHCKCQDSQRCDMAKGCTAAVKETTLKLDNKNKDKAMVAGEENQKSKDVNVVIYMTCVGVLGLLVVVAITVWKFRQTLFQLITSWKDRQSLFGLQGNRQQVKFDTEDNDRSSKLEQEIVYHVINEKEMISFCKT